MGGSIEDNSPMLIRSYQDSDEASVCALWWEVLAREGAHNDPALSIRRKVAVDRDLFLVAEVDGQVVGTAMGGYDGHRGWIYSLAVRPRYQRRGIGRAMIERLETLLAARGCVKIKLQILADNADVESFYNNLGYQTEALISMGKVIHRPEQV
jgi:hypothetical protein